MFLMGTASVSGRMAFEKLTDMDFRGTTYYTVRNLTLAECQNWCGEEAKCLAASFSFVPNPLLPVQETVCQLQNETTATNPSAVAQKGVDMYYMVKLNIRSENVCLRPWAFERVPNRMLRGLDNALIYTSSKEACLGACLNERRFQCRSAEYNYNTLQCHLSDSDRRTAPQAGQGSAAQFGQFIEAQGVDYFENLCLKGSAACKGDRVFSVPRLGIPEGDVGQYVGLNYYVDKSIQASSEKACRNACASENQFLCRSYLYRDDTQRSSQREGAAASPFNCNLYHMDHWSLPDGPSTFLNSERPLIDVGEVVGTYYENNCFQAKGPAKTPETLPVVIEKEEDANLNNLTRNDVNCDNTGTCYDVAVHCKDTRIAVQVRTNKPFNGRIYALGRSETCNVDVKSSDMFRLDLTMSGQDCNTRSVTGVYSNTVVLQHHSMVMTKADKIYKIKCTYDMSPKNITYGLIPIRDPEMISITSAPIAPAPRIRILDTRDREVETVRIGDKLTFRIEIPEDTPYGIFARSCVAMAKDSKSTFQIIDEDGCPPDPSIFPGFTQEGNSLQSIYEAFRFTESYGVIFQCNVKYCLGPCEPAQCEYGLERGESWGKRRRRRSSGSSAEDPENAEDMTLSQEILVLDFGDEKSESLHMPTIGGTPEADFGVDDEGPSVRRVGFEGQSCPTRTSVLALGVTCALLALLYATTVCCYCLRACAPWYSDPKKNLIS
ncbi:uncharacterized protein tyn [Hetaerina americana]|uniref:uncharacterized protein tyn n=1 Tax=Hetaerina americana TaxID=62018 RepID=UPI003A7F2B78